MQRIRIESIGASFPKRGFFSRKGSLRHSTAAGISCLKGSHYHAGDIQILINTGIFRDGHYAEPAIASFIQKELGINTEFQGRQTLSFDLQNSGCGMLNAAHVLSVMIQSGEVQVGMIISSEANCDRDPDPNYKYPRSGSALLLDASPFSTIGFGNFVFKTFEEYSDQSSSIVSLEHKKGHLLIRKNPGIEEIYLNCATEVLSELLDCEGLKYEDIDFLIPSQISKEFIKNLSSKTSFPINKIVSTSHLFSYTLTTSVFLGLKDSINNEMMSPGKKVVLLTVGSGVSAGATVYYF